MSEREFDLFFAGPPGLEHVLAAEARELGFAGAQAQPGGVGARGGWPEIWRANLWLRGANRVLMRVAEFRAPHLAVLDKRARRVDWAAVLRPDRPVQVEAVCRASKIYHQKAAATRVADAIAASLGTPVSDREGLRVMVRIEDDLCTISLDTSGEPLHRRGLKQAVGKAPLREGLAALFLRHLAFNGSEPVADPMCGSGTFPIEAAEIAVGHAPGRMRSFAFEELAGFDPSVWQAMRASNPAAAERTEFHAYGADRDQGAILNATANAARAGLADLTSFRRAPISDFTPPDGPRGLVMVNPPYGARIGNKKLLYALYGTLGRVLAERFAGWRIGLVTSEPGMARATGLPFQGDRLTTQHGGLTVGLYATKALP
ncbi:MAG: class I SAM-dependent RNA methyltransferase [Pseudomonadota bacterium]